jgi:hypothetical protein
MPIFMDKSSVESIHEFTRRHPNLLAAEGYVQLGLLGDALEEIEGLPADVAESVECVAVRLAIYKAASVLLVRG